MRGEKQAGQRAAVAGVVQAVAAERGHQGMSRSHTPPSAARARSISAGSMPCLLREGDQQRLVAGKMIEHAGEEARVAGGVADVRRGRCRWRRGSRRDARARRRGTPAPRRPALSAASRRALPSLLLRILPRFIAEIADSDARTQLSKLATAPDPRWKSGSARMPNRARRMAGDNPAAGRSDVGSKFPSSLAMRVNTCGSALEAQLRVSVCVSVTLPH